jgi:hypothetical protein
MQFILIIWLFLYFARKRRKQTSSPPPPPHFHDSIRRIEEVWDPHYLDSVLYHEVTKWPQYESLLADAAFKQRRLLLGVAFRDPYAINIVREKITARIRRASSGQEVEMLKASLRWVLQQVPELHSLFAHTTHKPRRKTKDLFEACKSKEDVKRRLRQLAKLNHPDHGGTEAAMKEVLKQYQETISKF